MPRIFSRNTLQISFYLPEGKNKNLNKPVFSTHELRATADGPHTGEYLIIFHLWVREF